MIEEGIYDGDFVIVLRRDRAEPGEMVVALVGDDATLKRFYPEGADGAAPARQPRPCSPSASRPGTCGCRASWSG